jgi:hypothetical protein
MTRNHRNRHHAGANDGGRSDLPAFAIDALLGIWSTWIQFGFDITQRWASLVQPCSVAERGNRLSMDTRNPAADACLWPHGLAGRARRMDRREVPRLVGLLRGCPERVHARPAPREYQPLLVQRRDRLIVLALLCAHARAVADSGRADHRRPDGVRSVSARDHPPAPLAGGPDLQRHPAMEHHGTWRPFRRAGAAGGARQ